MADKDGARIPFENSAYAKNPWGPFEGGDASSSNRDTVSVDMRGVTDFKSILRVDTGDAQWGQLVASCSAKPGVAAGSTDVENWPWVEVRVVVTISTVEQIWFEGAIGSHTDTATIGGEDKSAGPIFLPFLPGEVPDSVEIFARARRGGAAETSVDASEILTVVAGSRFRK